MLTDVAGAGGAEERVGDGVKNGISIGVAGETAFVADANTAEDERARVVERVNVNTLTNSNHLSSPHSA